THQGTSNLRAATKKCLDRNQAILPQAPGVETLKYSKATHRALIAVRCAARNRPFNMVSDPEYLQEVEMLCPGTSVPHPGTVSRDVGKIYLGLSDVVRTYMMV
ncbi:hypothetical protein BKA70DRAFT_1116256, partial [Coprinopsis sp. MPI-PUGE-AT-0042]